MARTEAQKRAVKLIRAAARAVIAEVDSRSDERVGTDFWAAFHFHCSLTKCDESNFFRGADGQRKPMHITYPIFVSKWSRV